MSESEISKIDGEVCPLCGEKTLTLSEHDTEVPFFGKLYVFSMTCSSCKYHKSDVEAEEMKDPCRYTLEIGSEEDMKIRVIKSSEATVKIPHMMSMTPGPASIGFVSNIQGLLERFKSAIETARDSEDDDDEAKKKAKNMLKKLQRVMWGQEKIKIIIEDPTGNSAIISDKAVKQKL